MTNRGQKSGQRTAICHLSLVIGHFFVCPPGDSAVNLFGAAELTCGDSLWIGLSQALALIPGVSRSGITISTALARDIDRISAARFSFLLSTPVIVGAGMLEGWHLVKAVRTPAGSRGPEIQWLLVAVGAATAAITGFLCIRYFLRYLQTHTLTPFVIYRIIFAGVTLLVYLTYSR